MNGELGGAGAAYGGLHGISPQMSAVAAAAVAAYGRTQVVGRVGDACGGEGGGGFAQSELKRDLLPVLGGI